MIPFSIVALAILSMAVFHYRDQLHRSIEDNHQLRLRLERSEGTIWTIVLRVLVDHLIEHDPVSLERAYESLHVWKRDLASQAESKEHIFKIMLYRSTRSGLLNAARDIDLTQAVTTRDMKSSRAIELYDLAARILFLDYLLDISSIDVTGLSGDDAPRSMISSPTSRSAITS